jgi:hypothetical protein
MAMRMMMAVLAAFFFCMVAVDARYAAVATVFALAALAA